MDATNGASGELFAKMLQKLINSFGKSFRIHIPHKHFEMLQITGINRERLEGKERKEERGIVGNETVKRERGKRKATKEFSERCNNNNQTATKKKKKINYKFPCCKHFFTFCFYDFRLFIYFFQLIFFFLRMNEIFHFMEYCFFCTYYSKIFIFTLKFQLSKRKFIYSSSLNSLCEIS